MKVAQKPRGTARLRALRTRGARVSEAGRTARSGIAAQSDEEINEAIYDRPTMSAPTLAQQMAESAKRRDQFKPPDQEGVYTNLNYFILGGIVQKITGADVGVFITENIIHNLGLRQTSYPIRDDLPGGLH